MDKKVAAKKMPWLKDVKLKLAAKAYVGMPLITLKYNDDTGCKTFYLKVL